MCKKHAPDWSCLLARERVVGLGKGGDRVLSSHPGEEALEVPEVGQSGAQLGAGLSLGVVGPQRGAFQGKIEEKAPNAP
jgi:hypothetical protein